MFCVKKTEADSIPPLFNFFAYYSCFSTPRSLALQLSLPRLKIAIPPLPTFNQDGVAFLELSCQN